MCPALVLMGTLLLLAGHDRTSGLGCVASTS